MSGFIGCIYEQTQNYSDEQMKQFKNMNRVITHRGPDDEGYYFDEYVQLGFRELNLKDSGNHDQCISFGHDRFHIVFNGKIYNNEELRKKLEKRGVQFQTESDPELICALYKKEKENMVKQLRGTFAFILWDKNEKTLFGARDPFGLKPFFYCEDSGRTFAASEKKSILLALNRTEINEKGLQHYLTYQFVPEPETMHYGIHKLEPGHYFIKRPGLPLEIKQYWRASFQPVHKSEDEFVQEIRNVLFDSVSKHMQTQAPIGSFLSGGIDSSLIASIAKEFKPDLKTFSVGFEREGYSEIDVAKETAEKIGVKNISYIITPEEYMNEIPKIMWHMDDPLADPACVPLYFAAREAKKYVTVVLSGEGADEFFGGYNIYREPESLKIFNRMPQVFQSFLKLIARMMPEGMRGKSFIERGTTPLENRYIGNAKMFTEEEKRQFLRVYNENVHYLDITKPLYEENKNYHPVERMQHIDIHTWLRGDILLKADKATMAHSVEVRSPFMDVEVFLVASRIPAGLKTANGTTKYILRKAAEGIVPDHVLNRKKLGFPVPIRHWLKDEMNDWAKTIIRESNTDHLIDKQYVLQLLDDHCLGKGDYSRKIWTVLMFMVWHQVFIERKYSFDKDALQKKTVAATN